MFIHIWVDIMGSWCYGSWNFGGYQYHMNDVFRHISPMCDHSLQLELWTGHREMHPQGTKWTVSTQAPCPTLRYCEGGMEGMDEMGFQVPVDYKDRGERLEQQALRDPLAKGVVGWSTQDGGKLAVQMSQELSWCMQGGLVEPGMLTREEQPTTSACLIIQTTSAINPEFKVTAQCMEWSMRHTMGHSQLFRTTMFPVLCAMLQRGWQSQWSQLKLVVHQHGLWNTLATSCQPTLATVAPCMSVLTRTQTQYQELLPVMIPPCSTMLKLTAMEWLVHLTTHRKNSPVQFVPNNFETTTHSVISVY